MKKIVKFEFSIYDVRRSIYSKQLSRGQHRHSADADWYLLSYSSCRESLCFSMGRHFLLKIAPGIWRCGPLSKIWFLCPTRINNPNWITIGSAAFAGLTVVTDRQTDRPRYSDCNNRRILVLWWDLKCQWGAFMCSRSAQLREKHSVRFLKVLGRETAKG